MRGDQRLWPFRLSFQSFNPRPALSCGATIILPYIFANVFVSIRAPHFHAGRPLMAANVDQPSLFQSAPRTFMRGDHSAQMMTAHIISFNPRPALSCGATNESSVGGTQGTVSIRAPHFHAGRRPRGGGYAGDWMFQSAPRTFMRGDCAQRCWAGELCVSIRAPHFHAGRPKSSSDTRRDPAFQSAPRTFMRGDQPEVLREAYEKGFNPRPALSCGATIHSDPERGELHVSIRAPHFHAGRPALDDASRQRMKFQSAPRTFMRGDVINERRLQR